MTLMLINNIVSGTGAYACQLAKNVFEAGKVITTVSTSKVAQIPKYLGEGVVDQGMLSSKIWCMFLRQSSHRLHEAGSISSNPCQICRFCF